MEPLEPRSELMSSLKELLVSGDFSDMTILCGPYKHKVHKAIICPRSEFFNAACRFGKEAETGVITLPDDDPEIVKLMIDYFYTLDCPPFSDQITAPPPATSQPQQSGGLFDNLQKHVQQSSGSFGNLGQQQKPATSPFLPVKVVASPPAMSRYRARKATLESDSENDDAFSSLRIAKEKKQTILAGKEPVESPQEPDGTSHLITLANMYAIADKYDIKGLQSLSQDKFKLAAANNWNHSDLPPAIYTVYTSTPDSNMGLRDIVVNLVSDHMSLLRKPEVEALMREFNGLAFDLLKLKHLNSGGVWS